LALAVEGAPVPVTLTEAVASTVSTGTYCTFTVQLLPGLTIAPATQVPPEMVKVPPAIPTLVIVGATVKVNGAVAAAALLTVMVPALGVVFAGVVVNAGEGALTVSVAPVTWKFTALVVPLGVETVMP